MNPPDWGYFQFIIKRLIEASIEQYLENTQDPNSLYTFALISLKWLWRDNMYYGSIPDINIKWMETQKLICAEFPTLKLTFSSKESEKVEIPGFPEETKNYIIPHYWVIIELIPILPRETFRRQKEYKRHSKEIGCLIGSAIGDSLGLEYKFMPKLSAIEKVKQNTNLGHLPLLGGGLFKVPPGRISINTEIALIIENVLAKDIPMEKMHLYIAKELCTWIRGRFAPPKTPSLREELFSGVKGERSKDFFPHPGMKNFSVDSSFQGENRGGIRSTISQKDFCAHETLVEEPTRIVDSSTKKRGFLDQRESGRRKDPPLANPLYIPRFLNSSLSGISCHLPGEMIYSKIMDKPRNNATSANCIALIIPLGLMTINFKLACNIVKIITRSHECIDATQVYLQGLNLAINGHSKEQIWMNSFAIAQTDIIKKVLLDSKKGINEGHYSPLHTGLYISFYELLHGESFEDSLTRTVKRGDDSDTTCFIVGALLGAFYGIDSFPNDWVKTVQIKHWNLRDII